MPQNASRWPIALRAAVSTAIPVLVGVAAGDLSAGLIATIGGFTAGFGVGRPYANRGVLLAVVAVSLAAAVALGDWAAAIPVLGVLTVTAVAVAAVWLCHALSVGPPGAYKFVVACAAGVGISAAHQPPWRVGLLVLAGGALAWVLQMGGALAGVRRPERSSVAAAAGAVAAFIDRCGTAEERAARHRAAAAMNQSWTALLRHQPVEPASGSALFDLRAANRELQVLFGDAVAASAAGRSPEPGSADRARRIGVLLKGSADRTVPERNRTAAHRPGPMLLLARAIRPGSKVRHVMVRVALAAPLAGALAALLGVGHIYWAMAVAVLMVHQGAHRAHTLRRGAERLAGTWVGLGLAGVILLIHPQGIWLAPILAALQFAIDMTIQRSQLVATVFITAQALTISSSAHPVDVGEVLLARGLDTVIGCAAGIAVFLVTARFQEAARLPEAIARTLEAVAAAAAAITDNSTQVGAVRAARRELLGATIALREADDAARAGPPQQRDAARRLEPTVLAADHLAYRTLATSWAGERERTDDAPLEFVAAEIAALSASLTARR